jgi:3-dehydroquinate dehydratase/shikimate dehydrogenase
VRGKDGRLFGFNTDVYGIAAALEPRIPLNGARVLVLGAGGAARAAVFGLKAKGAEVSILNRTPATAQALAKPAAATTVKRSELPKLTFDVIFNATPVGMGSDKHTPLEENELNTLWVFDSVYNPIETRLLKMAQAKGLGSISGTEMFVHQAARQFEIWTGKPAPIDGMRQVLLRQLGAVGTDSAPIPTVVPPKAKAVAANAASNVDTEASAAPVSESVAAAKTPETAKPVESKAAEKKNGAKEKPTTKEPAAKAAAVKAVAPVKAAPAKAAAKVAAKTPAKAVVKPKPAAKAVAKPAAKKVAKPVTKKK